MKSLGDVTNSALIAQAVPARLPWRADNLWSAVLARCESPIERLMCIKIYNHLGYKAGVIGPETPVPVSPEHGAIVYAQHEIGPYRADFLIVAKGDGWRAPHFLVVECDGHEFHSGIEAFRADGKRTIYLQRRGFEVARFTGQEIVRRASEVMGRIPEALGAQLSDLVLWGAATPEEHRQEDGR